MLCAVYKSSRKDETYLYVPKKEDFEAVPQPLMETFGRPIFVIMLNLAKREKLAIVDLEKVKASLLEQKYYLQLPPPKEDLLKEHASQPENQALISEKEEKKNNENVEGDI